MRVNSQSAVNLDQDQDQNNFTNFCKSHHKEAVNQIQSRSDWWFQRLLKFRNRRQTKTPPEAN